MGRYRTDYMLTHDIDYFFRIDSTVFHIASNGGFLPGFIDRQNNYLAQTIIYSLPSVFDTFVADSQPLRRIINDPELNYENYCKSFQLIASKGIVSMDRINASDPHDSRLIVVAAPRSLPRGYDAFNDLLLLIPNIQERVPSYYHNNPLALFSNTSYRDRLGKVIDGNLLFSVDHLFRNHNHNVNNQ